MEFETRIINIDVDNIRDKLIKLSCDKVKEENQINNIYDFPDKKLLNQDAYARIRIIEDKLDNKKHYYMTTKKLVKQDKFKKMYEHEVKISSFEEGNNIFLSLGLELIQTIKKYRESYKYKNTLIEIDINDESFCPFPYIEIETKDENELEEIVDLLGYQMKDTTSKTIYEILNDIENSN